MVSVKNETLPDIIENHPEIIFVKNINVGGSYVPLTDTGALMPYTVDWADGVNTLVYADNADAPSVVASPNVLDPTCGGGTNTTITVTVAAAAFNAAATATYTDTLEVIITAQ